MAPQLVIAADMAELGRMGADLVHERARRAVSARGVFRLVLSGGETPRALYRTLAENPSYGDFPWPQTEVYWGDERYVPPQHADSNYRMAREALLDHVPVAARRVLRMPVELRDPGQAAREYEETIRHTCGLEPRAWPRFDCVLLGIGVDGHTASLFPGQPALDERTRLVVAVEVDAPQRVRLTMTLPVFHHAAEVVFVAAGAKKAAAIAAAIQPPADAAPPPAALVKPVDGELIWLLDRAAARLVQADS